MSNLLQTKQNKTKKVIKSKATALLARLWKKASEEVSLSRELQHPIVNFNEFAFVFVSQAQANLNLFLQLLLFKIINVIQTQGAEYGLNEWQLLQNYLSFEI